ncbi:membrane hypothetical protein [Vibrio chagasii]|nr:membrane hypothetical protein [Vibrio chagasii]
MAESNLYNDLKMLRRFILLLIFSFSITSASANGGDEVNCGVTSGGVVIPLSASICPNDVALQHIYHTFPELTDSAASVFGLKYADEISSVLGESSRAPTARAIQNYIKYTAFIIMIFIKVVWFFQIFMFVFASIKDKKFGGDEFGLLGASLHLFFGVLLFVPYGDNATLGALLIIGCVFLALSISNIVTSSVIYLYQPDVLTSGDTTQSSIQLTMPIAITNIADEMIALSTCRETTQMAYIMDGFGNGAKPSSILSAANIVQHPTVPGDGMNGKYSLKNNTVSVGLFNDGRMGVPEYSCGKMIYLLNDLNSSVKDSLDGGEEDFKFLKSRKMQEMGIPDLAVADVYMTPKEYSVALSETNKLYALEIPFYQQLALNLLYKNIDTFMSLSDEYSRVLNGITCLEQSPLEYSISRESVKSMNAGSSPRGGIDLSCAYVNSNNLLSMIVSLDEPYLNPKNHDYDEESDALLIAMRNERESLLDRLVGIREEMLDGMFEVVKPVINTMIQSISDRNGFSRPLFASMRVAGFAGFGAHYIGAHKNSLDPQMLSTSGAILAPDSESTIDEQTKLAEDYFNLNRLSPDTVSGVVRSFFAVGGKNNTEVLSNEPVRIKTEDELIAELVAEEAYRVQLTNDIYSIIQGRDVEFEYDTGTLLIIAETSIVRAIVAFENFFNIGIGKNSGDYAVTSESDSEVKARFINDCKLGNRADFGYILNARCDIYLEHPMINAINFGNNLINSSFIVFGVSMGISIIEMGFGMKGGAKGGVASKVMSAAASGDIVGAIKGVLSNRSAITAMYYVAFLMLISGVFFMYVLPLIPQLIYLLMYMGWLTYALIIVIMSPAIFMSFICLKSKGRATVFAEKDLANIMLNLVFKPVLIVTSFTISWLMMSILFKMTMVVFETYYDGVIVYGAFSLSQPVFDFIAIFITLFVLVFAFFKVMHWSFTKPPQVLNMMMSRMGGENVISKEGAAKAIVGAAGYGFLVQTVGNNIAVINKEMQKDRERIAKKIHKHFSGKAPSMYEEKEKAAASMMTEQTKVEEITERISNTEAKIGEIEVELGQVLSDIKGVESKESNLKSSINKLNKLINAVVNGDISPEEVKAKINGVTFDDEAPLHRQLESLRDKRARALTQSSEEFGELQSQETKLSAEINELSAELLKDKEVNLDAAKKAFSQATDAHIESLKMKMQDGELTDELHQSLMSYRAKILSDGVFEAPDVANYIISTDEHGRIANIEKVK